MGTLASSVPYQFSMQRFHGKGRGIGRGVTARVIERKQGGHWHIGSLVRKDPEGDPSTSLVYFNELLMARIGAL